MKETLRKGVSFRYERTDKYDRLYDFTSEEELEYYRRTNAEMENTVKQTQ